MGDELSPGEGGGAVALVLDKGVPARPRLVRLRRVQNHVAHAVRQLLHFGLKWKKSKSLKDSTSEVSITLVKSATCHDLVGGEISGDAADPQLPVVDRMEDAEELVGPDLEVVELPDGFLGVLRLAVSDVAVAPEVTISRTLLTGQLFLPVDSTELQHEPQLEDLAHGAEDWDQLVLQKQMNILFRGKAIQGEDLKAVSGQSVAVDL